MATKNEERLARNRRVEQIRQIREANPQKPGEKDKAYWRRVAPLVNDADIRTDSDGEWTPENLRMFWTRHVTDKTIQPQVESTKTQKGKGAMSSTYESVESTQIPEVSMDSGVDASTQPPADSTEDTEMLRSLLADYERAGGLKDMLAWWTGHKGEDVTMPQAWPVIEGGRTKPVKGKGDLRNVSTAAYLDVELLEKALEKGKNEGARSLSHLLSVLMWRYIGSPPEMVKGYKAASGTAPAPNSDDTK